MHLPMEASVLLMSWPARWEMNVLPGGLPTSHSRFYDLPVADSVTSGTARGPI
jgi:hypothetical protein